MDEDGNVIPATFMEWATYFEQSQQRFIAVDEFQNGKFQVSTVFMGLNHNWFRPNSKPHWFETMVFGEARENEDLFQRTVIVRPSLWCKRCETLAEAKVIHTEGVAWLKAAYLQAQ
jgi:hypothetical protein